ncbi:MAG: hypothetical protein ACXIUD_07200 [Mongoliitalea sp.]
MKKKQHFLTVLIPDGDKFPLQSVLNCLSEVRGIRLHILSKRRDIPYLYSTYVERFDFIDPSCTDLEWIEAINRYCVTYPVDVILLY